MRKHTTTRRLAFTLLEVLLALAFTVVVVGLVATSVNGTLQFVERGRVKTERDQLARAVLTRIGDDVRGVVRFQPFDSKGMMSVKSTSKSGSSSKGGSSGQSASGGSSGGASGDSSGGSTGSTDTSGGSSDSSSATTTPTIAGVYGDQYGLQVDVGRLPRVDEYMSADSDSSTASSTPASDVRTVSYYLAGSLGGNQTTITAASSSSIDGSGLVRDEQDRSMALYASTQGGTTSTTTATVLAPEVVLLEFQYFDGTAWNSSWDSTLNSGLPQAVKISIALSAPATGSGAADASPAASATSISDAASQDPDSVYSLVVMVPGAIR